MHKDGARISADRRPADRIILEAEALHLGGGIEVSPVEYDGLLQKVLQSAEVGRAKLVPLRANHQGIGALGGFIGIFVIGDSVAELTAEVVQGLRVVSPDAPESRPAPS